MTPRVLITSLTQLLQEGKIGMRVRLPYWWILSGLLCVGFILAANRFEWSVTRFLIIDKSLWDWMGLLIVPVMLAVIAVRFQQKNTKTEREIANKRYLQDQQIALDKQREDLLQAYLDRMSELLLDKDLRSSQPEAEVRNVARSRTLTVLRQLDAPRKRSLIQFLSESKLLEIISLSGADLHGADLSKTNLSHVDLSNANLVGSNLTDADLSGADLSTADLRGSDLSFTNLSDAWIQGANLCGLDLTTAKLTNVDFEGVALTGAIMVSEKGHEYIYNYEY
jgi:Pentapeptide repeats (8 copies)